MARFGQFSHLWVEMAERLGLDVECLDVAWGAGVPVAEYARILAADTSRRDQGGVRHAQRDGDRRDIGRGRGARRRWMTAGMTRCCSSTA